MPDRFESMSLLIAVVDAGSFSAAARQLGVPLPTVSRKISELEAYLHTRVLQRSTRQLSLTEAGQSYVAACRRILEEIGEAERAVSGEYAAPKGDLVITTPIVFGRLHVLPVVTQFLKTYPEINIRVVLSDRLVHLLEEHVDIAIRVGELPDSSLVAARVGSIRRIVCASHAYLKAQGNPATPQDLSNHQCITFDGLTSAKAWSFLTGKSEIVIPIKSRLIVNTAEAAIAAAVNGLGLTRVLSYQVADIVRNNKVAIVLQDYEPAEWPIHLVHAGQGLLPLKVRAFLDFAKPRLIAQLKEAADMMKA